MSESPKQNNRFTKTEWSWMLYDWANSAHSTIVVAVILPIIFKGFTDASGIAKSTADAYWGYATSAATLLIAVLAPLLGTLGDFKGYKMRLFTAFAIFGMIATAALAFAQNWVVVLVLYALSCVGFYASNIYYDGFLVDVTSDERMDRVSSTGYGLGYIGGSTIPFIIAIVLLQYGEPLGIPTSVAVPAVFIMTALWWAAFTIPFWRNVRQTHWVERERNAIAQSFRRLGDTFRHIRQYKGLFMFILAYFFYIDGVGTIIHMATTYGDTLGLDTTQLIIALLATQIVAFPCAILYGRLAKRFGARAMIGAGIVTYMIICVLGFFTNSFPMYLALALLVGTAQGGIQALSRSYFGKLIPSKEQANEFYGFLDIFGKFATFMGPAIFGFTAMATGQSQFGVLSVMVLFVIGGAIFFLGVPKEKIDN